jgi:hypothetical protein
MVIVESSLLAIFTGRVASDNDVKVMRKNLWFWRSATGLIVLIMLLLEVYDDFRINPFYVFLVAAIVVFNFMITEMIDSKIGSYESDKLWENFSSEDLGKLKYEFADNDHDNREDEKFIPNIIHSEKIINDDSWKDL